jgi:hypothetical protein
MLDLNQIVIVINEKESPTKATSCNVPPVKTVPTPTK